MLLTLKCVLISDSHLERQEFKESRELVECIWDKSSLKSDQNIIWLTQLWHRSEEIFYLSCTASTSMV